MLPQTIIVYDYETGGADPLKCEITQIGAMAINPYRLEFIRDANGDPVKFESNMRPLNMDAVEEKALQVTKKTREELEGYPDPDIVWPAFDQWVSQFNLKGKRDYYCCPISAGHNIMNFDRFITQRYCEKYGPVNKDGKQMLFNGTFHYDTLMMNMHLHNGQKEPAKYNMDELRNYYGLSQEGGQSAIVDVKQTGIMLIKFLKLAQTIHPKVSYKGSMTDELY